MGKWGDRAREAQGRLGVALPEIPDEDYTRQRNNLREFRNIVAVNNNMRYRDLFPDDAYADAPRVWIVGGGPSLRDFDWSLLEGEIVIGVNRAYEKPNVGVCVSMDTRFKDWAVNGQIGDDSKAAWDSFAGPKVFTVLPRTPLSYYGQKPFYTVDRHDCQYVYPPTLDLLGTGNNSGWMALQLAWAMGARRINLLGFDMQGDSGRQSWWHGGYPIVTADSVYRGFRKPFEMATPYLLSDGVQVRNYCIDSGLTCFQKADNWTRDFVLRAKPERPTVVGYYTRGTGYENEAETMVHTARAMGLSVYVEGIEDRGGWIANTYYKAEFVSRMLERFNDRPILFLDADSRVRRYPAILDEMKAEFAGVWFDWDRLPGRRIGRELTTAVMYMRPTEAVRGMVRDWVAENARVAQSPVQDQRNFGAVVDRWRDRVDVAELPMTYCQIFDTMASVGAPVIEQMQASRRLKKEVGV